MCFHQFRELQWAFSLKNRLPTSISALSLLVSLVSWANSLLSFCSSPERGNIGKSPHRSSSALSINFAATSFQIKQKQQHTAKGVKKFDTKLKRTRFLKLSENQNSLARLSFSFIFLSIQIWLRFSSGIPSKKTFSPRLSLKQSEADSTNAWKEKEADFHLLCFVVKNS